MTSPEVAADEDQHVAPIGYITAIAELIEEQTTHRTLGRTSAESPANHQIRINALANKAFHRLKGAYEEEINTVQIFLGGLPTDVRERLLFEINKARIRSLPKMPRRRHRTPVLRTG